LNNILWVAGQTSRYRGAPPFSIGPAFINTGDERRQPSIASAGEAHQQPHDRIYGSVARESCSATRIKQRWDQRSRNPARGRALVDKRSGALSRHIGQDAMPASTMASREPNRSIRRKVITPRAMSKDPQCMCLLARFNQAIIRQRCLTRSASNNPYATSVETSRASPGASSTMPDTNPAHWLRGPAKSE